MISQPNRTEKPSHTVTELRVKIKSILHIAAFVNSFLTIIILIPKKSWVCVDINKINHSNCCDYMR